MYVKIPADGWPAAVDAHPSDSRVSDDLGGIPVRMGISTKVGVLVRDDCRDLPLNPGATYLASLLAKGLVPVLGPAVVVGLDTTSVTAIIDATQDADIISVVAEVVDMPADAAQAAATLAADAVHAVRQNPGAMSESPTDPGGTFRYEALLALLRIARKAVKDLPEDWPPSMFERADPGAGTAKVSDPRFII